MPNYRTAQKSTKISWLRDVTSQAWLGEFGGIKDALVARLRAAVTARFPELAPPDALAAIGDERGILRSQADTDAKYGTRLREAWQTWQFAGSAYSVLSALNAVSSAFFYTIVQQNGLAHTLNDDGTDVVVVGNGGTMPEWTFDSNLDSLGNKFWNRFGVILVPKPTTIIPSPAAPPTNVSTPNIALVNGFRRAIRQFKRSEAICVWIELVKTNLNGWVWGFPPGPAGVKWGDGHKWGAGTVYRWSPVDQ